MTLRDDKSYNKKQDSMKIQLIECKYCGQLYTRVLHSRRQPMPDCPVCGRKLTLPEYNKCRDCKWLNMEKKHSVGYECECPDKNFRSEIAQLKPPSTKACKLFERRK